MFLDLYLRTDKPEPTRPSYPLFNKDPSGMLHDTGRKVFSVQVDPSERFALTCDAYGRVFLLDTRTFVILRVFKGYRDAQCAWVPHPSLKRAARGVLHVYLLLPPVWFHLSPSLHSGCFCVCIYGGRRGVLELWEIGGKRLYFKKFPQRSLLLPLIQPVGCSPHELASLSRSCSLSHSLSFSHPCFHDRTPASHHWQSCHFLVRQWSTD